MTSSKIREAFEHWVRTNERFKFDDVSLDRCEDGFYMECRAEEMFVAWKAALHSVEAEKELEWISCDDRLPTEEDADCQGNLWVTNDNELFEPCLMHKNTFNEIVREMGGAWVQWKNDITHWASTGLCRPAPPEHKPE